MLSRAKSRETESWSEPQLKMSPTLLIVVLFLIGLILLVGELFLPTQGILGVFGCAAILCFPQQCPF